MKENKGKIILFLSVNLSLYIAFMGFSLPREYIYYFLTVLFSFLFTLIIRDYSLDAWLIRIALFFTVLADVFLVLLDGFYSLALCFFLIAQTSYMTRMLISGEKKDKTIQLLSQGSVVVLMVLVAVSLFKKDTVIDIVLAAGYFALLVSNIFFAFRKSKTFPLFWLGLVLFCFCDIFVGLAVLGRYTTLNPDSLIYKINHIPFNFIWFFYTPSQTILALTIINKKKSCHTREEGTRQLD